MARAVQAIARLCDIPQSEYLLSGIGSENIPNSGAGLDSPASGGPEKPASSVTSAVPEVVATALSMDCGSCGLSICPGKVYATDIGRFGALLTMRIG